jgi:pSer/pThr/pTyr-binding forkhead associated (FHA) protein
MGSIAIVSGPGEGKYFSLGESTVTIGRSETATIQIVDELVSGKHLQIRYDETDGGYHACDLQSTNGALVNNRPLTAETKLADGDAIQIGNSRIMFSATEFPDRESAFAYFKQPGETDKRTMIE